MKPSLTTDHPVAFHSPDHIDAEHGGSGNDNSTNPHFNSKLFARYEGKKIAVLDLGCAGGGFVKSVLDAGHVAVGLEGSDFCLKRKKFEWATIPDNLFTCDITKPFRLYDLDEQHCDECAPVQALFDVVTCWEVMEHIAEAELPQLIDNVLAHLKSDGLWIMSVSEQHDGNHFHRCVHNIGWWLDLFDRHGLKHLPAIRDYFDRDFVRGPHPTPWAITADNSFHLVLQRK